MMFIIENELIGLLLNNSSYADDSNKLIASSVAKRMILREYLQEVILVFGYDNVDLGILELLNRPYCWGII